VKPTVISLYTGVGGLDFGFGAAGFRTAVAVEIDPVCCLTIGQNRDWRVISDDIHSVPSRTLLRTAGLNRGEADVLIGGPPCQPFSKSGYWATGDSGRLDDPRADTLAAYLRVLRDTKPKAFLLENVRGLAYQKKDEGLQLLLNGIAEVNRQARTRYSVSCATLNAADYGVPQHRERVFLIGSRDGTPFAFPSATHGAITNVGLFPELEPHRTTWDAIGDLPQDVDDPTLAVGGRWGDLLPSVPEGENYLWHTSRGGGLALFGWRRRYWTFLLKLAKNRPSWTIQAQPGTATGPFHWRNRRLSTKELCRLQTFPDGLRFDCKRIDVQRMLGNAVPSLLAEVLGLEIRRQLLGHPVRTAKATLMPPRREATPRAEEVAPVPAKYMHLIGDHDPHPGTGRGYSRRANATGDGLGVAPGAR
jgi:DNA (cytosine-5)-methyltransferase 1